MKNKRKITIPLLVFVICIMIYATPNSAQSRLSNSRFRNKENTICLSDSVSTNNKQIKKDSKYKTFVKTKNKCLKCSCSGYWGYKHGNDTYEGNCSNTDSYGHRCGHGPEKHGLRKW